jgi:hypothetical protein
MLSTLSEKRRKKMKDLIWFALAMGGFATICGWIF